MLTGMEYNRPSPFANENDKDDQHKHEKSVDESRVMQDGAFDDDRLTTGAFPISHQTSAKNTARSTKHATSKNYKRSGTFNPNDQSLSENHS